MFPILFQIPTPTPLILPDIPVLETYDIAYYLALAEKYGLSMLLLAVVIIFLVQMYRQQNSRFDKLFNMVTEVKKSVPDPADEDISKIARLSMEIKGILRECQNEFGCEWIHLWQLHNGVRVPGPNRIPLMFMSLTYEIIKGDVLPVQVQFAQIPLSMVEIIINILANNPIYIEKSNPSGIVDNPITKVMFDLGATKQDFLQVLNSEGKLDSVLELCWLSDQTLSDTQHNTLKIYATRISIALASFKTED